MNTLVKTPREKQDFFQGIVDREKAKRTQSKRLR